MFSGIFLDAFFCGMLIKDVGKLHQTENYRRRAFGPLVKGYLLMAPQGYSLPPLQLFQPTHHLFVTVFSEPCRVHFIHSFMQPPPHSHAETPSSPDATALLASSF